MAANTRTKAKVQSDRLEITRLYLQGKYQHEIAAVTGLSQEMVSYDLRAVQKYWRDIPQAELNELKAKELAKIDHLERTYWDAWEKSQQLKEVINTSKQGKVLKVSKRTQPTSNGNAQYLHGVQWCISERCKLLGLSAPVKTELSGKVDVTAQFNPSEFTTEQLLTLASGQSLN